MQKIKIYDQEVAHDPVDREWLVNQFKRIPAQRRLNAAIWYNAEFQKTRSDDLKQQGIDKRNLNLKLLKHVNNL